MSDLIVDMRELAEKDIELGLIEHAILVQRGADRIDGLEAELRFWREDQVRDNAAAHERRRQAERRLRDVVELCDGEIVEIQDVITAAGYVKCERCGGSGKLKGDLVVGNMRIVDTMGIPHKCDCINGWRPSDE